MNRINFQDYRIISSNNAVTFSRRETDGHIMLMPHWHPHYEIMLITEGHYTVICNGQSIRSDKPGAYLFMPHALHQITADAYAALCRIPERSAIDTLLEFFFENYTRRISLDEMAELVHLNKSYFVRVFRREIGQTPLDYLNGIRLSHAKELLLSTNLKVSEIAFRSGFESASYFIRRFSAAYGDTPEKYRLKNLPALPQTEIKSD
jgi:AraC-like DNA-binding protein